MPMKAHEFNQDPRQFTAVYGLALGFVVGFGLFYAIPEVYRIWIVGPY